jgi:hypothetical protein
VAHNLGFGSSGDGAAEQGITRGSEDGDAGAGSALIWFLTLDWMLVCPSRYEANTRDSIGIPTVTRDILHNASMLQRAASCCPLINDTANHETGDGHCWIGTY